MGSGRKPGGERGASGGGSAKESRRGRGVGRGRPRGSTGRGKGRGRGSIPKEVRTAPSGSSLSEEVLEHSDHRIDMDAVDSNDVHMHMRTDEVRQGDECCESPREETLTSLEDEDSDADLRERYAEVIEGSITEESVVAITKNGTETSLVLAERIDLLEDKVTSELVKIQSSIRRIEDFIER